ncbi:MAG: VOC family protein, partial [Pseudomonadota bacterium]
GPFIVWEWIPRHSDAIRIAFIERVAPPLEGWPNIRVASRTFNSTQIVSDMDEAAAFYQGVLGFQPYLEHIGPSEAPGEHVLGLSREAMVAVTREVRILSPQGDNEGSVELLEFRDYTGRDFSDRARPPNLGVLMLRYPVPDVEALAVYFERSGVTLAAPVTTVQMAPYGAVKTVAVQAPDGAWLEFFEDTSQ